MDMQDVETRINSELEEYGRSLFLKADRLVGELGIDSRQRPKAEKAVRDLLEDQHKLFTSVVKKILLLVRDVSEGNKTVFGRD